MKRVWTSFLFAAAVTLATFSGASAQGKFDGAWNGTVGHWTVKLVVKGEKGRLSLTCFTGSWDFDIPVGADGVIQAYIGGPGFNRRQVSGQLPSLTVATGGQCAGGTSPLSR